MQHARTGGGGDGGAAGRAARGEIGVPGIAGEAEARRVGHRFPAEFGGGGLADENRAGVAPGGHGRRVGIAQARGGGLTAIGEGPAPDADDIFDRDRDPVDGRKRGAVPPARFGGAGGGERTVMVDEGEGVEFRIDGVGAVKGGADNVHR